MVYLTTSGPAEAWGGWPLGRLAYLTNPEREPAPGEQIAALERLAEFAKPGDVIGIRLFRGSLDQTLCPSLEPERLPEYDDLLAVMREAAGLVRGWLIGSQGYEVSFRHLFGAWRGNAGRNINAICAFVQRAADAIAGSGGELFVAPMDFDVIQDAYRTGGRLAAMLAKHNATAYVACGYTLVPGAWVKRHRDIHGDCLRWQSELSGRGFRAPTPGEKFPVLKGYLRAGNFWSGLGGETGVRAGNIQLLSAYGFKGFSTHVSTEAIASLNRDFDGWNHDGWDEKLLRLRVNGSYSYRGRTYRQGQPFLPRDRKERGYLLSIGGEHPIFEQMP